MAVSDKHLDLVQIRAFFDRSRASLFQPLERRTWTKSNKHFAKAILSQVNAPFSTRVSEKK